MPVDPQPPLSKPDAFKVPAGSARGETAFDRLFFLKERYAPLLGQPTVTIFNQGPFYFIARSASDSLLFPSDHPRHPADRYDWVPQADGVIAGTYVDGAHDAD